MAELPVALSAARPFALCFTSADVHSGRRDFPNCRPVALTPDARAALVGSEGEILTSRAGLTDFGHARVVGWMRQVEEAARRATASRSDLRPLVADTIVDRLVQVAQVAGRLWHTVFRGPFASGPWLIRFEGRWHLFSRQQGTEAFRLLLERISPFGSERERFLEPPLPRLFSWLRDRVAELAGKGARWIVSPRANLVFNLDSGLWAASKPTGVVRITVPKGWREYPRLLRTAQQLLRNPPPNLVNLPVCASPQPSSLRDDVEAIAASTPISILKPIMQDQMDELTALVDAIEGHVEDAARALRHLRPQMFVAYQSSSAIARTALAAAVQERLPRLMYSYNGHTVVDGAIARSANERHYRLKFVNRAYDSFACWSPSIAALTRRILAGKTAAVIPVLSMPSASAGRSADYPRVLHAGSFLGWGGFLPWVIETSDEYCDSILALDRAMATLPGTELVVRAKQKSECGPEHLTKLMKPRAGLTVTDTAGMPYHVAVQEADLLVSFMSTTIEEALMLRRPVLLWGGTSRYRHLPACTKPPSPDNRAAVYAVDREPDLAPMVSAILAAHRGRPLTDAEIAPFAWPQGTPGVKALADAIADGDPWRPWRGNPAIRVGERATA